MLADLDISILRLIHQNRIVAFDQFLYFISYTTSFVSIGIVLSLLFFFLKFKSKHYKLIFIKMLAVLIVAATVSFTLKNLITRERPFKIYPDIEKLSEAGSASFPSGHTMDAFALAMALSLSIPKWKFIIPVYIWASIVAYSRMALGVHYPSDVLSGMLIGSFIGWIVPLLIKLKPETKS